MSVLAQKIGHDQFSRVWLNTTRQAKYLYRDGFAMSLKLALHVVCLFVCFKLVKLCLFQVVKGTFRRKFKCAFIYRVELYHPLSKLIIFNCGFTAKVTCILLLPKNREYCQKWTISSLKNDDIFHVFNQIMFVKWAFPFFIGRPLDISMTVSLNCICSKLVNSPFKRFLFQVGKQSL